ncbi:Cysteine proteinase [Glarea lozoyensis ATCC 20868]|uniref:Ubiquitin carboxyl-terminal hydrolase n=1 Tax=Glarea lozoyensis (strain ATCC 20868 / MF5171) TaxID=1116229 RepID=S3CFG3_GLAL2|nr:Cysteine proteinase [Glarea lozoyensis ATCC 20868]EPE25227.1 Cysteine proteinase [Glarea lozoyensis ATCC 20868]
MPERPLTIAYAAGAGLAAIALVYVFQPTFFIDGESAGTSASSRKRGIVGLSNPANDCFINSVLQALAGLGDLRIYLIRETHRRKLEGPAVYSYLVQDPTRKDVPAWKLEGLQSGLTTYGLKDILDALNERPIYKKTVTAAGFVNVLEQAFKQRISRQQQDAQEFLQVVAERLCDEYHAGQRARNAAKLRVPNGLSTTITSKDLEVPLDEPAKIDSDGLAVLSNPAGNIELPDIDEHGEGEDSSIDEEKEEGFPLEGGSAQQIECLTCKYQPKATETIFCTLSLSVPQVSSTTLNACFDDMFKTEYIEDFKCEKCRLVHALETFKDEYKISNSERFKAKAQEDIRKIEEAIKTDPEQELKNVQLPDSKFAPRRKIAKHVRITKFPKVLAIHLSRSIHNIGQSTMKNSAKVSFPERLRLGGLLDHKMYRLVSVVCHKGSHHSGHYETFRRQHLHAPFSTPNTFHRAGAYSKPQTPNPSQISTPQTSAMSVIEDSNPDTSTISSTPELLSPDSTSSTSLPLSGGDLSSVNGSSIKPPGSTSRDPETGSLRSLARSAKSSLSKVPSIHRTSATAVSKDTSNRTSVSDLVRGKRKRSNRWWRISDDKIKESKTSDVLGMQKEVYMLFYELEKEDGSP